MNAMVKVATDAAIKLWGTRPVRTAAQAFLAVYLAGFASEGVASVALWQKAAVAGAASLISWLQNWAEDRGHLPDCRQ